ncbi:MAG: hypothetical protein ACHQRM_06790 [Bacteroidia bacterium]
MKKIISFFFVASLVTLVACGGKKSDLVAGSWKIGDMSMPDMMPKDIPDSIKTQMEARQKAMVDEMKKTAVFDFNKDGSYSYKMLGKEVKGKWKMADDDKKITMKDETPDAKDAKEIVSEIVELTATKFVMSMTQDGGKDGAKSTITLVK